ncbi:MAG: hypothetical protein ABWZ19_09590, partial [Hyphomicrobium sp.]
MLIGTALAAIAAPLIGRAVLAAMGVVTLRTIAPDMIGARAVFAIGYTERCATSRDGCVTCGGAGPTVGGCVRTVARTLAPGPAFARVVVRPRAAMAIFT